MSGPRQPIPSHIGKYQILRKISEGGMAEVFLGRIAQQSGFEKLVAIKRILPHLAEEKTFVEMFLDEARIAALLNHSNIAQIFDLGTADSGFFIAMEYVRGVPLSSLSTYYAAQQLRPPYALAAFLLANVCAGLEYAHTCCDNQGQRLNIVHRDVSPSNILISTEGSIKLIDFGIAKAAQRLQQTQAGKIKGKFGYMSPEQVRSRQIDHRSDIFSAGMVLYELLTGDNPFCGANTADSFERARRAYIPPPRSVRPAVPSQLEAICLRALAVDPDARYQSAREMELDLDQLQRQLPYTRLELATLIQETFGQELSQLSDQRDADSPPADRDSWPAASPSPSVSLDRRQELPSRPDGTVRLDSRPQQSQLPGEATLADPRRGSWPPGNHSAPLQLDPQLAEGHGQETFAQLPTQIVAPDQQSGFAPEPTAPFPRVAPEQLPPAADPAQTEDEGAMTVLLPLGEAPPAADEESTRERPAPTASRSAAGHRSRTRPVLAGFAIAMFLALAGYIVWVIQRIPPATSTRLPVAEPLLEDAGQAQGFAPPADSVAADSAAASRTSAATASETPADAGLPPPHRAISAFDQGADQESWSTYHVGPKSSPTLNRPPRTTRGQRKPKPRPRRRRPPRKTGPRAPPIPFDGL